ncbi:coiled-coil domain-containing protein 86 [Choristoneura fumiferana]|uniref:coiled-coil domain-containing protein 86 n=1 Tax=Choristoneura fumiferana TaxID=7141 RepID=UPI003D155208
MAEAVENCVQSIVATIKKGQTEESLIIQDPKASKSPKTTKMKNQDSIRGQPKSGRFWKSKKERFATVNKTKGLTQDFQKKTALRLELKRTKELSRQVVEELKQKELARKERRRENIKRSAENRAKAEVVQVITNTTKLKRMRKKQLRFIQKRDTNKEIEANK